LGGRERSGTRHPREIGRASRVAALRCATTLSFAAAALIREGAARRRPSPSGASLAHPAKYKNWPLDGGNKLLLALPLLLLLLEDVVPRLATYGDFAPPPSRARTPSVAAGKTPQR